MTKLARCQYAFAAHIRSPQDAPRPPDVEDRRMAVYRELVYNNIQGFLASNFPVLHRILPKPAWHALVRDFFARHRTHTPLFHEIPQEFLHYLAEERGSRPGDPPFMLELAHYEWAELALSIAEQELDWQGADPKGDLLAGPPVLSPLAWPLAYRFAVHRISPACQPAQPGEQPTYLVVYRDRRDEVGFLAINAVTARLLERLREEPQTSGRVQLERIAGELQHPQPQRVIEGGREILEGLRQRDIVLGTRVAAA